MNPTETQTAAKTPEHVEMDHDHQCQLNHLLEEYGTDGVLTGIMRWLADPDASMGECLPMAEHFRKFRDGELKG